MLTRCPNCDTTFRITGAVLRAAAGHVRCGRCAAEFDAIAGLIDEPAWAADTMRASIEQPSRVEDAELEARTLTEDELERIFVRAPDWSSDLQAELGQQAPSEEFQLPAADGKPEIVVDEPDTYEEITLEGRRIEISGRYPELAPEEGRPESPPVEYVLAEDEEEEEILPPLREPAAIPAAGQGSPGAEEPVQEAQRGPESTPQRTSVTDGVTTRTVAAATARDSSWPIARAFDHDESDDELERLGRTTPRRRGAAFWSLASLLLSATLLVQVLHHYRQDLVRHPQIGPALKQSYEWLGIALAPNWDLASYELQQWGAIADPSAPGILKVRASIRNSADFAQPYPLLRLVLEDLWGARIGVRDFEPRDYLPAGTSAERLMSPSQRSNAELAIIDPGADAVGFRLDVCLHGSNGLNCIGDDSGRARG